MPGLTIGVSKNVDIIGNYIIYGDTICMYRHITMYCYTICIISLHFAIYYKTYYIIYNLIHYDIYRNVLL